MFFNSISSIKSFEQSLPLIQMIGEGSVGPEFSSMFTMFIHNKLDKLISPKHIMEHDEKYVLNTLKSLVNPDDNYRADIASTLSTRLVNYLEVYSKQNPIEKNIIERISNIVKEKSKQTCLEKYGVESNLNIPEIKEKCKESHIKNKDKIKEKSKQTCLEKYGVEYSLQSKQVREKSKQKEGFFARLLRILGLKK